MTVTVRNLNNDQIIGAALRGENATTKTGNMSTDAYTVGHSRFTPYQGSLPKAWARVLSEAFHAGRISQVIYSYSTPIAWHDSEHGWIIPIVTYSVTTSNRHQSQLWKISTAKRILLPWDATHEDAQRVMDRKMYFANNGRGVATRTFPGPNYVAGE